METKEVTPLTAPPWQVETKERHVDDIRKDLELACIEADKVLSDQVDIDMKIKVRGDEGCYEA